MVVVRKWGKDHINQSLKQIDLSTWLIGQFVLRRLPYLSDTATWNDHSDNSSYVVSEAALPLPPVTTSLDSTYIKLVHEAGDLSAVWSIGGDAFCKVRYIEKGVTLESETLDFVQRQNPSFQTPKVLYHVLEDDKSYLFLRRLPGRILDSAWPTLNEFWRRHYVDAVLKICQEMATWKGDRIGGVDQRNIPEYYLVTPVGSDNFSSLQTGCKAMGMDCLDIVFYHADLSPNNIIVEDQPKSGTIGLIDFEISGYVPRGWIRTKFRVSDAMNLSKSVTDDHTWWRREVQKALGEHGFQDYSQAWNEWRGYKPRI
jgi:Choline/ethanolamine kinase